MTWLDTWRYVSRVLGWMGCVAMLLASAGLGEARTVRGIDVTVARGETTCMPIVLGAEGNEIALSLSLCFDTNLLSFVSARRGGDATTAYMLVNTNQVSRGRIGLVLWLPGGTALPQGDNTILEVCFRSAAGGGIVTTPVSICDQPIVREILDTAGNSVAATYTTNAIVTLVGSCSYRLTTNSATFSSGGGGAGVVVTAESGCAWSAASLADWITINAGSTGSGTGSVGFDVAVNPAYVGRTGVVVVAGQAFTVMQAPVPCSFRLNLNGRVHGPAMEFNFVEVNASSACPWAVVNTNDWITIASGGSGTGNGRIDYWVGANSAGVARTGVVMIAGVAFTVRQLGYPCTYTLTPESRVHSPASEAVIINVTAPAGCAWYVVNTNSWMIIKLYTNGVGNDIVRYTVFDNPRPVPRSGVLTIGGQPFTVYQVAAPCVYSLLQTNQLYGPGPAYDTISIATLSECSWTATTTNNWIVIFTPNGTGGGPVNFYVSPNTTSQDRKGSILIGNKRFVLTQLGTPCSYSISTTSRSITAGANTGQVSVTTSVASGVNSSSQTCHWTALNTNNWITTYLPMNPANKGTLRYSVAANNFGVARSGVLIVAGKSFTITQAGVPCIYSVSPSSRSHGYEVEVGIVNVTAVNGCAWTASTTDPWITLLLPKNGVGNGIVNYRLVPNTGPARSGRITVGGAVFTVNQGAASVVTFTNQPVGRQVAFGANVSFTASVTGTPPFTYQWRRNGINLLDGPGVSGVNTPTLSLQNVQHSSSGNYSVVVSNLRGPATSASALLTVNTPPRLNPIPGRSTVPGSPVTFTASATDLQAPPQKFTYSLAPGAPVGSSINATSGVFMWTPPASQAIGGYPVTVNVIDNGTPPLSDELTTTISLFAGYTTNVSLITTGSVWKYRDTGENLGTAWTTPGFDDALWAAGPGNLGYGNGNENTTVSFGPSSSATYITTYFRTRFSVSDPSMFSLLNLRLLRDDGAVVYLNGVEIFRDNMPAGAINYLTLASIKIGSIDETIYIPSPPLDPARLVARDNVMAVEIHQNTAGSSDIVFDLELTGRMTVVTGAAAFLPAASAAPIVRIALDPESGVTLSWDTVPAMRYRVEYRTDMADPAWLDLTGEVIATSDNAQMRDAAAGVTQRFYRVLVLP